MKKPSRQGRVTCVLAVQVLKHMSPGAPADSPAELPWAAESPRGSSCSPGGRSGGGKARAPKGQGGQWTDLPLLLLGSLLSPFEGR